MNYKADFGPSELLCPTTKQFVTLDSEIKAKIESNEYYKLTDNNEKGKIDLEFIYNDDEISKSQYIDKLFIDFRGEKYQILDFLNKFFDEEEIEGQIYKIQDMIKNIGLNVIYDMQFVAEIE